MNIKITPWKPGDGGLLCLPLRSNIPDASKHPDWKPVKCPKCGRDCWEPELARLAMAAGASGVCTECAVRAGLSQKENVLVPNPVHLIPYRTFLEVEQPGSDFVFRVSEGRGGAPVFKLVAADGGVWESQALENVRSYLVEALKDIPDREKLTIIA